MGRLSFGEGPTLPAALDAQFQEPSRNHQRGHLACEFAGKPEPGVRRIAREQAPIESVTIDHGFHRTAGNALFRKAMSFVIPA
jgi:hypothetical protein